MPEGDAVVRDHEQAGVLGGLERRGIDSHGVQCGCDCLDLRLVRERGGDDQERALRVGRQRRGAAGERTLERGPRGDRLRQRLTARQLIGAEQAADLEERERVPVRRFAQVLRHVRVGRFAVTGEQYDRVLVCQRAELEALDARQLGVAGAAVRPGREEEHDGVRDEPLGGEQERVGSRAVEPLGVVDDDEQGPRLGRRGEQVQRCRAGREAVERRRLPQSERASEHVRLRGRQLGQVPEQRPQQLEQAGELELGLGLDAECPDDRHPLGAPDGIVEQRCLADPGFAAHEKRTAAPTPTLQQQLVDAGSGGFPTDEHYFHGSRIDFRGQGGVARSRLTSRAVAWRPDDEIRRRLRRRPPPGE